MAPKLSNSSRIFSCVIIAAFVIVALIACSPVEATSVQKRSNGKILVFDMNRAELYAATLIYQLYAGMALSSILLFVPVFEGQIFGIISFGIVFANYYLNKFIIGGILKFSINDPVPRRLALAAVLLIGWINPYGYFNYAVVAADLFLDISTGARWVYESPRELP